MIENYVFCLCFYKLQCKILLAITIFLSSHCIHPFNFHSVADGWLWWVEWGWWVTECAYCFPILMRWINEQSKEEQNQSDEALAGKNTKTGSPLQENLSSLDEQYSHILQWPYSTQQAAEQSSLNPRPCAPSQSNLPIPQWQQEAPLQPNSPNHPVQQGQPTVHLAQSTTPFWLPQQPSYHFPGVSVPATFQPFTSIATVNASWKPSSIVGRTTPRSQDQVPNLCYHFGPYPGFPGSI